MDINVCLNKAKQVHFIGIGGVSMSALALMLSDMGYSVTGSDDNPDGWYLTPLKDHGINVQIGRSPTHITGAEMVIYTAAVKEQHPELLEAKRKNIPVFRRPELLSAIIKRFECPLGVAGTHGKTTTTAMITAILTHANLDPTVMIGGHMASLGGNYRLGRGNVIVFESDEYMDSFLQFFPKISVILNVESDHPDYFDGLDDVISSFKKYIKNTQKDGTVIYNTEDENCRRVTADYQGKSLGFGLETGDVHARNIENKNGYYSFDAVLPDFEVPGITLRVPGIYNMKNALAACAAAMLCGANEKDIKDGLSSFSGVARRFELIGNCGGAVVVDDYAHHPSEVAATLNSARNQGFKRVVCVFQPHTYTRTKGMLESFSKALALADKVVLADIYAARENDVYGISSAHLAALIPNAVYWQGSLNSLAKKLKPKIGEGDLVITMGAGNIDSVARILCSQDNLNI